jgi:tetratricopeptide (TPR) repeat protein
MAQNDSTDMAIDLFRQLLTNDLNDRQIEKAELDLGILLYNKGEYEEAKSHFAELTKDDSVHEPFVEKGWWFYGNALLNTGDIEGAHNAINIAYGMKGKYSDSAFELMKKMDTKFPNSSLNASRSL